MVDNNNNNNHNHINIMINNNNGNDDDDHHDHHNQDRLLPIANVGRLMKQMLPAGTGKVSKEARQTMQECATEFVSFITAEASERCRRERRKTLNGDDVCWALQSLGFDDYVEPITRYLHRYRETAEQDRANNRDRSVNNQVE